MSTAPCAGGSLLFTAVNGRVRGKVKAGHVIMIGVVCGAASLRDLLECRPKACVTGDMRCDPLDMHDGAFVEDDLRRLTRIGKPALILGASNDA
jgi:cytoskeletal protein CcmA (bactofilin family)